MEKKTIIKYPISFSSQTVRNTKKMRSEKMLLNNEK